MPADVLKRVLLVCVILSLPVAGYAQEAVLTGTVTDATGGVLPGVTVTAVHEATGTRSSELAIAAGSSVSPPASVVIA